MRKKTNKGGWLVARAGSFRQSYCYYFNSNNCECLHSLTIYRRLLLLLQDESTAKERRDEDNGTANQRRKAELGSAETGGSTLGAAGTSTGTAGVNTARGDGAVGSASKVGSRRAGSLGTVTGETRALSGTVLEEVGSTRGNGRELVALHGHVPGLGLAGALRSGAVGLVTTVAAGVLGTSESGHEGLEVVALGDAVAVDLDEAVVGVFLRVLVDETTRVDASHVGAVKRLDFGKLAGVLVAAVFGQAVEGLVRKWQGV